MHAVRVWTTAAAAMALACSASAQPAAGPAKPPPEGWNVLPEVVQYGGGDIFNVVAGDNGDVAGPWMHVHTKKNVSILTRDVSAPLTAATTLKWRWNFKTLPTKLAETSAANHDYISIAVKFENGRDLTYMWSAVLPVGTGFACPLPGWESRETHVVIRSGGQSLGQWLLEEHAILADYGKHIGGPAPGRIVQVWLIANSIIQQTEGEAIFADISIGEGPKAPRVRVF